MKAVVHRRYGPADEVLAVEEVDEPQPQDGEVLVRVRAASMHADVWHVIEGVPFLLRLMGNGVRKPKLRIPGTDLSGVVEAVGKNVTRFVPGDAVFGESARFGWMNGGAYAEYAAVREDYLVHKPENITFEQAAAIPTAGFIALNNLASTDKTGQSVLINGAGGAMGTLAYRSPRPKARASRPSIARRNYRCCVRSGPIASSIMRKRTTWKAANASIESWMSSGFCGRKTIGAC